MNSRFLYGLVASQRVLNAVFGILMLLIIGAFYQDSEAGEIYLIFNAALLYLVFEAGLPKIIVNKVAAAGVNFERVEKEIASDLVHYALYYFSMSVVGAILIVLIGYVAEDTKEQLINWILLAVTIPALSVQSFIQNVLEGAEKLVNVSSQRLTQVVIGYGVLCISLISGAGEWAVNYYYLALALSPLVYYRQSYIKNIISTIIFGIRQHTLFFTFVRFKDDLGWQLRLSMQTASDYVINQSWLVIIGLSGNLVLVSKLALLQQVVFSIAGFSLIPGVSRFAEISRVYHKESRDVYHKLCRKLWKETTLAAVGLIFIGALAYFYVLPLVGSMSEKMVSANVFFLYIAVVIVVVYTNYCFLLENSKGRDNLLIISLLKMVVSFVSFAFIFFGEVYDYVQYFYFFSWVFVLIMTIVILKSREMSCES